MVNCTCLSQTTLYVSSLMTLVIVPFCHLMLKVGQKSCTIMRSEQANFRTLVCVGLEPNCCFFRLATFGKVMASNHSVISAVSDSSLLEIPLTESLNFPVDSPNPLVLLPSAIPVPTVCRSTRSHRKPQRLIEELT